MLANAKCELPRDVTLISSLIKMILLFLHYMSLLDKGRTLQQDKAGVDLSLLLPNEVVPRKDDANEKRTSMRYWRGKAKMQLVLTREEKSGLSVQKHKEKEEEKKRQ